MAEDRRLAKQPMLYIVQPKNLKPAEVPMQTSFRTQRSSVSKPSTGEQSPSKETPIQEREIRMRRQQSPHIEELSKLNTETPMDEEEDVAEVEEKESSEVVGRSSSRERRQRFHDLSLEEKVNYFFNLSPHVPKMKCEVSTEVDQYRGYITDYQEEIVHMKVFQRPFHREIPFEDIKDIRLLGF
ncbi:CotO family spore coat protein [Halobacillus litoralis]|uniref:CotO family spore coat protein n=1 Tax=Halobacillus litoralis TaxID=45668 RepID=UPI001CFDA10C|nr:CotO family spore coat protein [Halobacillus litoralis]